MITTCPKCYGPGGWCAQCGKHDCDHIALWMDCPLCSGEGELDLPPPFAEEAKLDIQVRAEVALLKDRINQAFNDPKMKAIAERLRLARRAR